MNPAPEDTLTPAACILCGLTRLEVLNVTVATDPAMLMPPPPDGGGGGGGGSGGGPGGGMANIIW